MEPRDRNRGAAPILGIGMAVAFVAQQPNSAGWGRTHPTPVAATASKRLHSRRRSRNRTARPTRRTAPTTSRRQPRGQEGTDELEGPNSQSRVNERQQGANHHGDAHQGNASQLQDSKHNG